MKTLLWIIILAALIIGGLFLYKKLSAKPEETPTAKVEEKVEAVKEETETAQAKAETTAEKNDSGKGVKNWRPVKKVIDLSNQHNKDLENNM